MLVENFLKSHLQAWCYQYINMNRARNDVFEYLNFSKKVVCAMQFLYMFSLFEKRSVHTITSWLHRCYLQWSGTLCDGYNTWAPAFTYIQRTYLNRGIWEIWHMPCQGAAPYLLPCPQYYFSSCKKREEKK